MKIYHLAGLELNNRKLRLFFKQNEELGSYWMGCIIVGLFIGIMLGLLIYGV